jgi:tetratricopeptide (TPR) repeat protein
MPRSGARSDLRPLEERQAEEPVAPRPRDHVVLQLQGDIGNAAVSRLLARAPDTATTSDEPPITAPGITGAQLWNQRGVAHYEAGRFEQARAAFAEAYRLNPISTFLYDQADALERLGRRAEAAEMYERYLAAGPLTADIPKVRTRLARLRGQAVPESEDAAPVTAKGRAGATEWFDRGQQAFLAGHYVKAADGFRQAFELEPMPAFIYDEGSALEKGRHLAAAANAYEHYLFLDPSAKEAKELIGKIKAFRGQAPQGDKDALMDPEDDPAMAPAVSAVGVPGASEWHNRGTVAYQLGDFKRSYDCFVQAFDLHPAAAFVFNQAASLDRLGNTDAAVQAYERYLALSPKATDTDWVRTRIKKLRDGTAGLKTP